MIRDPQSIIVYRNPLEYALWNTGIMFPIICGVLGGLAIRKTWINNIIHNDPLHMPLLVQRENGKFIIESHHMPIRTLKSLGVPFRKIKGGTEYDVMNKLENWFIKNASALQSME